MDVFPRILLVLFYIIQAVIALYILTPFFSVIAYSIVRLLGIRRPVERKPFLTDRNFEIGIIVTAHQETEFIFPLVDSILRQTYGGFDIYVVADDCDPTLLVFDDPRVHVILPSPALHAKVKSIDLAIRSFVRPHDVTLILDSDNLLHPKFLETVNTHFRKGYRAVQADFKPKNTDTLYARMDALGDMFNFFIDRETRMRLGFSSAIWGSGIAFESRLYDDVKYKTLVGGFDKKLQYTLVLKTRTIAFAPDAILYDEKISSGKTLENQRARWIHSYFNYFGESAKVLKAGLRRFNLNLIWFGFVLMRPPLFMTMFAGVLMMIACFFINPVLAFVWLGIFFSFFLSFVLIVLIKGNDKRYLRTLFILPVFAFRQVLSILKLKKASKKFLKTPHTKLLYIDDILKG
ncbi:MAG: glycosyltransferase [Chitinophagaceae bacterium]|nr:MAG: glycosyltransferase [Chitinophagaceae bacterium]